MSIKLIRSEKNINVSPKDDRILFEKSYPFNGIMYGCTITHLGSNQVHITAGRGIYKGNDFVIEEQNLAVQLSSEGNQKGRIYIKLNLANEREEIVIRSLVASQLPELANNDNFNVELGIGEMELATYNANELIINDLKMTYEVVKSIKDLVGRVIAIEGEIITIPLSSWVNCTSDQRYVKQFTTTTKNNYPGGMKDIARYHVGGKMSPELLAEHAKLAPDNDYDDETDELTIYAMEELTMDISLRI